MSVVFSRPSIQVLSAGTREGPTRVDAEGGVRRLRSLPEQFAALQRADRLHRLGLAPGPEEVSPLLPLRNKKKNILDE